MQLGPLTDALGRRSAGRTAGWLYLGSAIASAAQLVLPQHPGLNRPVILVTCILGVLVGLVVLRLPWDDWDARATLVLVPVALAMIGIGNYYASPDPHAYGVLYIVVFAWVGMYHARWTSLWFAPAAGAAYVLPILLRADAPNWGASSAALTISAGILVAEFLAWHNTREIRHRERTEGIARVSGLIGPQLDERTLCQMLAEQFRRVLGTDRSVLFRLDGTSRTITDVYWSGHPQHERGALHALVGVPLKDQTQEDRLAAGKAVVVERPRGEDSGTFVGGSDVKSYVALPIMAGGRLAATVLCYHVRRPARFESEEIALARTLAVQSGLAFENMALYAESLQAAKVDALTQLPNRRAFHERLHQEIERASGDRGPFAVVLFDIDGFRRVNEAWGTLAGDRVLHLVGSTLERLRRSSDTPFRLAGDEFALLLPDTNAHDAMAVAEQVRARVTRSRLGVGHGFSLSLSLGVCIYPDHGQSFDELFDRLNRAVDGVKAAGGDAVALPQTTDDAPDRSFGIDVQRVIEGRHLVPAYQPIVEIGSGRVLGYECFSRLDPAIGVAPAQTLFRAAEESGLMVLLDETCREVAIEGAHGIPDGSLLFLNIAPATLESESYSADTLERLCAAADLPPQRVVLEVTEQQRYPGSPMLAENLARTKSAGFKVALDDLGSTGADLELLARLDFDYVKVDMSFVHGAHTEETRRRVLHGMGMLVERTGAGAIAEGVEGPADLMIVRDLGFRYAQGYYLSEPLSSLDAVARTGT